MKKNKIVLLSGTVVIVIKILWFYFPKKVLIYPEQVEYIEVNGERYVLPEDEFEEQLGSVVAVRTMNSFYRPFRREGVSYEIVLRVKDEPFRILLGERNFAYDWEWTYDLYNTAELYDTLEKIIDRCGLISN